MDNKEWEVSSAQLRKTHGYSTPGDMKKASASVHKAGELARDILRLSRNTLLIDLRFLEAAFIKFIPQEKTVTAQMATDGRFLYYDPIYICRRFQKGKEVAIRDYLHVVFHCLFRHLFTGKEQDIALWDIACDIAVENSITKLGLKCLYCEREEKQKNIVKKLSEDLPLLNAEHIYGYLREADIPQEDYEKLRENFYADDHKMWYGPVETEKGQGESRMGYTGADNQDTEETVATGDDEDTNDTSDDVFSENIRGTGDDTNKTNDDDSQGESRQGNQGEEREPSLIREETEEMWQDIARRAQVDLDTFSDTWGDGAGDLVQTLKRITREKYDYGEFLKRFASPGENMQINDEEFDYIFYTYGLKLYGNVPLVEPLEYKEVQKVRDFVIALDTSESVSGDLVQKFVTKTWNILKQTENFFTKVNVHLIQCGARVEEDKKITCQEEFDAYMEQMVLKGFGGTDFRPVFTYVDKLQEQNEFTNLKGMIFFTDGYGTYPAMPSAYETAFVFMDQGRDIPDVPPWAIKLVLTEEEIEDEG